MVPRFTLSETKCPDSPMIIVRTPPGLPRRSMTMPAGVAQAVHGLVELARDRRHPDVELDDADGTACALDTTVLEPRKQGRQVPELDGLAPLGRAHQQARDGLVRGVEKPEIGVRAGLTPQQRRAQRPGPEATDVGRRVAKRGQGAVEARAPTRVSVQPARTPALAAGPCGSTLESRPVPDPAIARRIRACRRPRAAPCCRNRRRHGRRQNRKVRLAHTIEHLAHDARTSSSLVARSARGRSSARRASQSTRAAVSAT